MSLGVHSYPYESGRRVEVLATSYLRFHGYLTTPHFVLHRPDGTPYTDADISPCGSRTPARLSSRVKWASADPGVTATARDQRRTPSWHTVTCRQLRTAHVGSVFASTVDERSFTLLAYVFTAQSIVKLSTKRD